MAQEDPLDPDQRAFGSKLLEAGKKLAAGEDPGPISQHELNFASKIINESKRLEPSIRREDIFSASNLSRLRDDPRTTLGKLTASLGPTAAAGPAPTPATPAPRPQRDPFAGLGGVPVERDPFEGLDSLPISDAEAAGELMADKIRDIGVRAREIAEPVERAAAEAGGKVGFALETLFAPEIDLIKRSATQRQTKTDIFLDAVFPFRTFQRARQEEEKLWGLRSRFGNFLQEGYRPLFDFAQSVAPVEEVEQDTRSIVARTAIETAGTFFKGGAEIIPVTPLEVTEMAVIGTLLGAGERFIAQKAPAFFRIVTQSKATEAPGQLARLAESKLPLSVQSQIANVEAKVIRALNRAFGRDPDFRVVNRFPLGAEDVRVVSEAFRNPQSPDIRVQAFRAAAQREGLKLSDIIKMDQRVRAEEFRLRGGRPAEEPKIRAAADKAAQNPEQTVSQAVREAGAAVAPAPPEAPIRAAAFLHRPTGQVIETGRFHDPEPLFDFARKELGIQGEPEQILAQMEDGFVTREGTFVNRQQAAEILAAQQAPPAAPPAEQPSVFEGPEVTAIKGQARALRPLPEGVPFIPPQPPPEGVAPFGEIAGGPTIFEEPVQARELLADFEGQLRTATGPEAESLGRMVAALRRLPGDTLLRPGEPIPGFEPPPAAPEGLLALPTPAEVPAAPPRPAAPPGPALEPAPGFEEAFQFLREALKAPQAGTPPREAPGIFKPGSLVIGPPGFQASVPADTLAGLAVHPTLGTGFGPGEQGVTVSHLGTGGAIASLPNKRLAAMLAKKLSHLDWSWTDRAKAPPGQLELVEDFTGKLSETLALRGEAEAELLLQGDPLPPVETVDPAAPGPRETLEGPKAKQIKAGEEVVVVNETGEQELMVARQDAEPGEPVEVETPAPRAPEVGDLVTVKVPEGIRNGEVTAVGIPEPGRVTVEFRKVTEFGGVPSLEQRNLPVASIQSIEKPIKSEPVLREADPEPSEIQIQEDVKTVAPELVEPVAKPKVEFVKKAKPGARVRLRDGIKDPQNINTGKIVGVHPQTGEITVEWNGVTEGEPFVVGEKSTLPATQFRLEDGSPLTQAEAEAILEREPREPREQPRAVEEPAPVEREPAGAGGIGEPGATGVPPLEEAPPGGVSEAPGAGDVAPTPERGRRPDAGEVREGVRAEREERPEPPAGVPSGVGADQPGARPPAAGEPGPQPGQPGSRRPAESELNHRILPEDRIGEGGKVAKYNDNVAAIRLLKKLEADGRPATPDEKKVLARYVGWGGIPEAFDYHKDGWTKRYQELQELLSEKEYESARASTPNAHYTSFEVVSAIYDAVAKLGITGGRILEPSMGTGNFFGMMPPELMSKAKLTGVELDSISGRIAGKLYPVADIRVMGFEDAKMPDNFYDLAISNVPFGDFPIADKKYAKTGMTRAIHNYFFAKSLDKVRPGGVLVMITSRFTMDAKSSKARKYIEERAELVEAIRLPETAFAKNAQTSVVTDLLIFRKKVPGQELPKKEWIDTVEVRDKKTGEFYFINKYFSENPGKMLGKSVVESKMFGSRTFNLKGDGREIGPAIREALAELPNVLTEAPKPAAIDPVESIPAPGHVKPNGLIVEGGKVMRSVDGMLREVKGGEPKRVSGIIGIRDELRELQRVMLEDKPDTDIKAAQKKLSKSYDAFVKKFGNLRDRKNLKAFVGDPDAGLMKALENQDAETKKISKADIFTKRVISPVKKIERVDTAKDALVASLNELGRVDLERMSQLSGRPVEQLIDELKGLVFKDPEGPWVQAEAYLSGNVRKKLEIAQAAAKTDKAFKVNVDALKAVQPKDLEPGEIDINLGAPWVFPSAIDAFVTHLTGVESGFKSAFVRETGSWVIDVESSGRFELDNSVGNNQTWGTQRYPAVNIVRDSLQGKVPTVYDPDPEKKGKRIVNTSETAAARQKQEQVKEEFRRWLFEDRLRREALVSHYNFNFNNYRPPAYDGGHLVFPGANPLIEPRAHQKNAVWRVISSGRNSLLAHVVGAGKTYTVVWAALEMRRMGLRKKPMVVVPNHLLTQWQDAFGQLYPSAKVLVATEDDFTPARRQFIMSQIATGDWDAVVVPQTSFKKLPMSAEFQSAFFAKKIAELEAAIEEAVARGEKKRSPTVKQLEKAKKRLEARLKKALNAAEKDVTVTFEELGVDHLFIDESQDFKKLFYASQMNRVAGLPDPAGSQRAFDLFMKTRYLDLISNRAGTTFATGTPITNTIAEMFSLQQYLQESVLEEAGLNSFDAWAAMYGEMVTKMELATEGGNKFISKTRFSKFVNTRDLFTRYLDVADPQGIDDINLKRPKLRTGKAIIIKAPASEELKNFIKLLGIRADAVRSGKVDPAKDNMLKISTEGRKASVDMRLIEKSVSDFPESKINKAVMKVFEIWGKTKEKKLTQVVFLDIGTPQTPKKLGAFTVYDDMKAKLIRLGIPKEEIAFIHDIKNSDKDGKKRLFERVNRGKVRVLFGSTGKMGTGMNVQQRLVALHHIDAPWRPDQVEQRDGRILRQGNENDEVEIFRYVTVGSFDVNLWQILENKSGSFLAIQSLRPGRIPTSMDDISDVVLSPEEVKAIATGDPRIKQKVEAELELRKLAALETAHRNAQFRAESDKAALPDSISRLEKRLDDLKSDRSVFSKTKEEDFKLVLRGKSFDKRVDAGQAIIDDISKLIKTRKFEPAESGEFRGRPLRIGATEAGVPLVSVVGKSDIYRAETIAVSPKGMIQSLEAQISDKKLRSIQDDFEKELAAMKKRLKELDSVIGKEFPEAGRMKELQATKAKLDKELGITKSDSNAVEEGPTSKSEVDQEGAADASGSEPEEFGGTTSRATTLGPKQPKRGTARRAGQARAEGNFLSSFPVELGSMGSVKPLEMPELVRLARELAGDFPTISKRLRLSRGLFKSRGVEKQIILNPEIFKEPQEAAAVLAHEIGHLIDYLPHNTMKRGNLLGRMLSLRSFLRNTFGDVVVTNKELREELVALSEMWRPYDKETAPESFIAYRNSSAELYADAISVLLNTPGTLERMAPKFYRAFFDNLDKKPEVKSEFFKLQDFVSGRGADLLGEREQNIREMFQKGEALTKQKIDERRLRETRIWEKLRQDLDDINHPINKKVDEIEAKGQIVPDEKNPKFILQEASMAENDVFLMLDKVNREVVLPLKEQGNTMEDLGLMLFLDRILGDRSGMANPLGQTPTTAAAQLERLQENIGPERFVKLRQSAQRLHDINFEIVEEAVRLGTYNAEVFAEKIKPNKDFYATFQVLDFIDDFVPAGVKAQIGTLREIGNPAVSTILKMVSLVKLNVLQTAKIATRDFLFEHFRGEIEKAKIINPQDKLRQFRRKEGFEVLTVLENGRQVGYYVDPYIAKSFERKSLDSLWLPVKIIRWINTSAFYPLLITYNPGFALAFNPIRDIKRTLKAIPDATLGQLLREMWKVWPTARKRALGINDELMTEMLKNKAMTVPYVDFILGEQEDGYSRLLVKHGIIPEGPLNRRQKLANWLVQLLEPLRIAGSTIEALPKIAGYNLRKAAGEKGKTLPYNTRNFTGTPNWLVKGAVTAYTNALFMFSNIFKEGTKTGYQLATQPRTRSGWWWKTAEFDLGPKLLMFLASVGAGGKFLQDFYDRVSEYDKTNYVIIPLGIQSGGTYGWKAVYLRIPHDEETRLVAGMMWKLLNAHKGDPDQMAQILDFGAGQLPSVSPAITITSAWKDYLTGKNPYDAFRGRQVISQTEWKAGGWPRLKKMVQWTVNQSGLARFATYDTSDNTWFETAVQTAPIVNRLIRVTDYGMTETINKELKASERVAALFKLDRGTETRAFKRELFRMAQMKKAGVLSEEAERRLRRIQMFDRRVVQKLEKQIKDAVEQGDQARSKRTRNDLERRVKEFEWRGPL